MERPRWALAQDADRAARRPRSAPPRDTLLDHGETPAVVTLAAPLGTAPALEANQALVHGLALPLVVDPDAVLVLIQVDCGVIAGLTRVAAVRLERGDRGPRRNVRVPADLGTLLP